MYFYQPFAVQADCKRVQASLVAVSPPPAAVYLWETQARALMCAACSTRLPAPPSFASEMSLLTPRPSHTSPFCSSSFSPPISPSHCKADFLLSCSARVVVKCVQTGLILAPSGLQSPEHGEAGEHIPISLLYKMVSTVFLSTESIFKLSLKCTTFYLLHRNISDTLRHIWSC